VIGAQALVRSSPQLPALAKSPIHSASAAESDPCDRERVTDKPHLTGCCSDRSRDAAAERWIWQSRPLRTKWQDWIAHLMIMANSFSWVPWIEPAYNFRDSAPLLISLYSSSGRCPPRHIHNTCELMSSPNGVVSEYAPVLSSVERVGLVASCTDQTQKHRKLQKYISPTHSSKRKKGQGRRTYRRSSLDASFSYDPSPRPTCFCRITAR
jgi:hypothetical protein